MNRNDGFKQGRDSAIITNWYWNISYVFAVFPYQLSTTSLRTRYKRSYLNAGLGTNLYKEVYFCVTVALKFSYGDSQPGSRHCQGWNWIPSNLVGSQRKYGFSISFLIFFNGNLLPTWDPCGFGFPRYRPKYGSGQGRKIKKNKVFWWSNSIVEFWSLILF